MTRRNRRSFNPLSPSMPPSGRAPLPPSTPLRQISGRNTVDDFTPPSHPLIEAIVARRMKELVLNVHTFVTGDATHMAINTDEVLEDVEVAAIYFRGLIAKEIPTQIAAQLTSSYMLSHMNARENRKKPKEPWEDTGGG